MAASGASINHVRGDKAFYAPVQDQIYLPLKEQFRSPGAYYATALHELGHWTGHESRLDREMMNQYGTPAYAREELRAEISSLMMTREFGVPHDPGQHAAYVGGWVQVLESDPTEILRASRDAAKIKDFLMDFERRNIEQNKPAPTAEAPEPEQPVTVPDAPPAQTAEERLELAKEGSPQKTEFKVR